MFYSEHGPPHLHAVYGECKMTVDLDSLVIHGEFRHGRSGWCSNGCNCISRHCSITGTERGSVNPCGGLLHWSRCMNYDVIEARYVNGFVAWLKFRDGTAGEIDLSSELTGPVFEPLRDVAVFPQFQIHPEFHTRVWPNGADLAPEFLYDNVRVTA